MAFRVQHRIGHTQYEIDRAQEHKAIAQVVIQHRAGACFVCGQAVAKGEKLAERVARTVALTEMLGGTGESNEP